MSPAPMDPESATLVTLIAKQVAHATDLDAVIVVALKRRDEGPTASVQLACYGRTEDDTPFAPARIPKIAALLQGAITMLVSITGGSIDLVLPETPIDLPPEG
jgi:hypothetical protein